MATQKQLDNLVKARAAKKKPLQSARLDEAVQNRSTERRRRKTGQDFRVKLAVPEGTEEKLNGHVHWFNDVGDRVMGHHTADDYEFVTEKELGLSQSDEKVSKVVGSDEGGNPIRAFLMVKRKEYYAQDQAEKQRIVDETEAGIFRGEHQADEPDKRYVPKGSINVSTKVT